MPALTISTTLAAELGHNTSANAAYNESSYPVNFTGITWVNNSGSTLTVDSTKTDDSLNPITPCHVSNEDIHALFPGYAGPIYAHVLPWFRAGGGGGHLDFGLDNSSTAWIDAATADLQARGFNGITIDWYGSGRFEDTVTLLLKAKVATMTGFTYCIMVDLGGYSTTAGLETELSYIESTYFGTPGYLTQGGHPVVMFFGTVAGVNYATAKASIGTTMYWVMQGSGSLANAYADGCFDWVQPYSTGVVGSDPYHAVAANSYLTNVHSSAKGSMPCLAAGFNGYLTRSTAWAKGKYMPRDSGKCWLTQASVINANRPTNMIGIQIATWNDWEEGSAIETAIDNNISITTSVSGDTLSWSVSGGTGDETTIANYRLLASADGINAAILGTVAKGSGNVFDLSTITGWGTDTYTIYVIAVGRTCIRNQVNSSATYVVPAPPPPPPPPPVVIENPVKLIELPDAPSVSKILHPVTEEVSQPWVEWFRGVKKQHPFFAVSTDSGNQVITLPSGAVYLNREHLYLKSTPDTNTITINGAVGGAVILSAYLEKARFRYDGKNWYPV